MSDSEDRVGIASRMTDYAVALQRAIECHCRGEIVPECVAEKCPHHAELLNYHFAEEKQVRQPRDSGTHWDGCWYAHHDCAIAMVEQLVLRSDVLGKETVRRRGGQDGLFSDKSVCMAIAALADLMESAMQGILAFRGTAANE